MLERAVAIAQQERHVAIGPGGRDLLGARVGNGEVSAAVTAEISGHDRIGIDAHGR